MTSSIYHLIKTSTAWCTDTLTFVAAGKVQQQCSISLISSLQSPFQPEKCTWAGKLTSNDTFLSYSGKLTGHYQQLENSLAHVCHCLVASGMLADQMHPSPLKGSASTGTNIVNEYLLSTNSVHTTYKHIAYITGWRSRNEAQAWALSRYAFNSP